MTHLPESLCRNVERAPVPDAGASAAARHNERATTYAKSMGVVEAEREARQSKPKTALEWRMAEAKETGRLWLEGEAEIPFPCKRDEALSVLRRIGSDCGYAVCLDPAGRVRLAGSGIVGEYVMDWFGRDAGPLSVSRVATVDIARA